MLPQQHQSEGRVADEPKDDTPSVASVADSASVPAQGAPGRLRPRVRRAPRMSFSGKLGLDGADVRRGHAGRPVAALDERAQVANEPRLLPRRQRLVHGLLQRRRERIRGEVPKGVPVARLGRRVWFYFQLERELDVGEARRFDPGEEVALVPADERFGAVAAANLLHHVPYVPNVVAGEDPVRFGPPETVDRLEHRESPATTQHSEELAQCGFLVVEIDHHGTRRDGVDGGALQRQLVRRRAHELAARIIVGDRAADVQDVLRDIAEDYATVLADQPERTEPDQPFAAADVEHGVALLDARSVEDATTKLVEHLLRLATRIFVPAEAALGQPRCPEVGHALSLGVRY